MLQEQMVSASNRRRQVPAEIAEIAAAAAAEAERHGAPPSTALHPRSAPLATVP